VIEGGARARLAFKAVVEFAAGNFDGDRPAEARVAAAVNLAHATSADQAGDFIGTQLVSG